MNTFVADEAEIQVPEWIDDLKSFQRWLDSDEFPEQGRVCYMRGEVWIDMSKEQLLSHIRVKDQFTRVLGGWVEENELGLYFSDGLRLTNAEADISTRPDGSFLSRETLVLGRAKLVEGAEEGFVEVEGTPDMVLEV